MSFEFDAPVLMLSLIPGGVGFVLMMYGRKQNRWPQLLCGILLIVYPYFTTSVAPMISVGVAVGAALYAMLLAGW